MEINIETLQGKWDLVSFKIHLFGISWNWGHQASGFIDYNASGKMKVEIHSVKIFPPAVADLLFSNQLIYGGSYVLNGQNIQHHLEYSSVKPWIGKDLKREIVFLDSGKLILQGGRKGLKFVLIWQK
jgi:hypothetical protein